MANEFKVKNGLKVPLNGILKGNSLTAAVSVATDGTDYISPASIQAAAQKTTPVGADEFALLDSAASYALKALTYTNLKAAVTNRSVTATNESIAELAPATYDVSHFTSWKSSFWTAQSPDWGPTPGSNIYRGLTIGGYTATDSALYGAQIAIDASTSAPILYFRTMSGGASPVFSSWMEVWSSNNDGSGSGLDADKLRGTTPTTAGLALLDDADTTAQLTTLGIHDGANFTFDDGLVVTLPGNTEKFQILGSSTSLTPVVFNVTANPPAGSSCFINRLAGVVEPTGAVTTIYANDLRVSWRSTYDITTVYNTFIRGDSTTAQTGAISTFQNLYVGAYWLATEAPATWNQINIQDVTVSPIVRGLVCAVSPATDKWNIYASGGAQNYFSGSVGIGEDVPASKLHSVSSSLAQLRLGYDATYYTTFTTGSTGNMTIDPVGTDVNILATIKQNGTALLAGATGIVVLTDAEYAALGTPVSTILYITTG